VVGNQDAKRRMVSAMLGGKDGNFPVSPEGFPYEQSRVQDHMMPFGLRLDDQ
jgi:hypothetical protein